MAQGDGLHGAEIVNGVGGGGKASVRLSPLSQFPSMSLIVSSPHCELRHPLHCSQDSRTEQ